MPVLLRGALLGMLCAGVGAAAWTWMSIEMDARLWLMAIVIGGLAGFGVGMGNRGRGGATAGAVAACVVVVMVLASRGVVSHVQVQEWMAETAAESPESAAIETLAGRIYEQFEAEEIEMSEPEEDELFPAEVLARAHAQWRAMSKEERAGMMADHAALIEQNAAEAREAEPVVTGVSFVLEMGIGGWFFMAMGMGTAFKTAETKLIKTAKGWRLAEEAEAEKAIAEGAAPMAAGAGASRTLGGLPPLPAEADADPLESRPWAKKPMQAAEGEGKGVEERDAA